jgi:3'(2'), 5'-bisphosphate nucleotidase
MTDFAQELGIARNAAVAAGRLIMEVYATSFDVVEKAAGAGPVTEADHRANEYIVSELRRAFPTDGIVAEESPDKSEAARFERCWYVDPLDGTKEFVARNGEFAVHIGLAIGGEAVLGVVLKPADGKLYSGTVRGGSTLEWKGTSHALQVSDRSEPTDLRLLVSRSHRSRKTAEIQRLLGITQVIESGSVGVKCGLLAEAVADLYLHPSPQSSRWDSCAPEAVLRGAGGRLTDVFGNTYRYDGSEIENPRGLVGCNAVAFDRVLEVLRQVVSAEPS